MRLTTTLASRALSSISSSYAYPYSSLRLCSSSQRRPRLLQTAATLSSHHLSPPPHFSRRPLNQHPRQTRRAMATITTDDASPAPAPAEAVQAYQPRYIDIGINLADPIFRGEYHGKRHHDDDLEAVVARAQQVGCAKLLVTGSDFESVRQALELNRRFPDTVYSTVGIHPCSSAIFGTAPKHHPPPADSPCAPAPGGERTDMPDAARTRAAIAELRTILSSSPPGVVAFGEFGLDYDRLFWCSRAVQLHSFHAQLALVAGMPPGAQLPLFLHSRAAHVDFVALMKEAFGERLERLERGGVVHSFTGTMDEMRELAALGLYVGVNGCSLKTDENCAVVREIPLDRLMLETDGPWCEVRSSHAGWKYLLPAAAADAEEQHPPTPAEAAAPPNARRSRKKNNPPPAPRPEERFKSVKKEKWEPGAMVRGRNEPCMVERVAAIVAAIKGVSVEEVCEAAWANTVRVFGLGER